MPIMYLVLLIRVVYLRSFLTAAALRTNWKFGFPVTRQQDKGQSLLNNVCKQVGLWLYNNREGKISCKVQDSGASPVRAFLIDHMTGMDGNWACDRTPRDKLINYINLRHDLDRGLNIYNGNKVKAAVFRQMGTGGSITQSGSKYKFTSTTSDGMLLLSGGRAEIYTLSGKRLRVVPGRTEDGGRTSEVIFISGTQETESNVIWWLGDSIDPDAMKSYLLIGAHQTMGGQEPNFLDLGAFLSDYIVNDTTAEQFVNHQTEWHFLARTMAAFDTWWRASDLEQTDCILIDHPKLPPDDRPQEVTTLSQSVTNSSTTMRFASVAGLATGQYILIGKEIVRLGSSAGSNTYNVHRQQLGTDRTAHTTGSSAKQFKRKFYIKHIGYRPMSLDWRLTTEAFPGNDVVTS